MRIVPVFLSAFLMLSTIGTAGDWLHWRGPNQNGISSEKGLVEDWDLEKETNVVWHSDIGGRSTPIILNGRVYLNCRTEHDVTDPDEKIHAREQVVCWDAETGKELWKDVFNVFLTDIAAPRVGWANMAGDKETGYVYVHSVSGLFRCYNSDGKVIWETSLLEDHGKIAGYGGRTHTPVIDEDRVIVSFLATNWGDMKGPAPKHYYYCFDKKNGDLLWIDAPGGKPQDTTFSCPIISVVNGQRMLIAGNADGGIYGINARTGKKIWGHQMSRRGINASPVLDGDMVYITHGEDNLDNTDFGRVECLKIVGEGAETRVESFWRKDGIKAGYSSPLVKDGILYVVADTGSLHAFDSKTGEKLWDHSLGTVGKGAPAWADGKIYVMEVDGNIHILKPSREKCETLSHVSLDARVGGGKDEIYASPAICNGLVYLATRDRTICIGKKAEAVSDVAELKEDAAAAEIATLQLRPYEVILNSGESANFKLHAFDKHGRFIKTLPAEITVGEGLEGATADGATLSAAGVKTPLAGTISASSGELTATARVRVFPPMPWKEDFESFRGVAVPPHWMRAHLKIKPAILTKSTEPFVSTEGAAVPDDANVAMNMAPGIGRPSHTVFMGKAEDRGYVIQADVLLKEQKRKLASVGLTNQRYNFIVKANTGKVAIQTWQAHLRLGSQSKFRADPDVWYTMKMRVDVDNGVAKIKGKVWERDQPEPDAWTLEAVDPHANESGSPGLYGYRLADCYFDNVIVTKEQ